ncbi:unnamed protein product, partial [Mesorhabditis spiculigera]
MDAAQRVAGDAHTASRTPVSQRTPPDLGLLDCWHDSITPYEPTRTTLRRPPIAGDHFTCTRHEPVRACGQIIPWNFQLLMQAGSWAPLWLWATLSCLKAGFPEGVVNILSGFGPTSAAVVAQHMGIAKAFTGSTEIGRLVHGVTERRRTSSSPTPTLDEAVEQAHHELFFHQSQCCGDASRTFVEGMAQQGVGAEARRRRPLRPRSDQGPQIDGNQGNTVSSSIRRAGKREGAFFTWRDFRPGDVGDPIRLDGGTLVEKANNTIYGLAAAVVIQRHRSGPLRCHNIRAGSGFPTAKTPFIWFYKFYFGVNCYDAFDAAAPFGGYKQSGEGFSPATNWEITVTIKVPQKNS